MQSLVHLKKKAQDRLRARDSEELRKLRFKEGDILYSIIERNSIVMVKKVLTQNPEHEFGEYLVQFLTFPYLETKVSKFLLYKPNGVEAALLRNQLKGWSWKIRYFIGEYIICGRLFRKINNYLEKRVGKGKQDDEEE